MRLAWILVPVALWAAPPQPAIHSSGLTLYRSYCASCHGTEGRGDGPAAQALVMRPADLRTLAIRNNGKFPVYRVVKMLGGADDIVAHGSKRMPVWGPSFAESNPNDAKLAERVKNLVTFLESIQEKAAN